MERGRAVRLALLASAVLVATGGACSPGGDTTTGTVSAPSVGTSPSTSSSTSTQSSTSTPAPASTRTVAVAQRLDVPWGLAFLPDGSALVTLRDRATLLQVREGSAPVVLGTIAGVQPGGEGGLLGVAVSPNFEQDHHVFVYLTGDRDNRVVRLTWDGGRPAAPEPVLTGIPKAGRHNGGRLAFGPDGFLYVTTGDAGESDQSQDREALGGKILRITQDGRPAPGNPFGESPVWSYGHRNVQGIAWAPDGRMYASEFGQNTWDELNLIEPGRNYGWPEVEGRAGRSEFVDPLAQWPTSDASPSGIAVAEGAVYMTALRGEALWRVPLTAGRVGEPQRLLHERYGRLRDVVADSRGRLWVLTNNTFRGSPGERDDQVLAIPLATLR